MTPHTSILLAEDQHLIRQSLLALLQSNPAYTIAAAVQDGEQAMRYLEQASSLPNLCILDVQMPNMDGINCAARIRKLSPDVKIALLTSHHSDCYMEQGLLSGVNGYLLKDTQPDTFDRAIQLIMDGYFAAPWPLISPIASRLKQYTDDKQKGDFNHAAQFMRRQYALDDKDIEIIRLIWLGWTNRMIADDLYISEGTVKNYVSRIYRSIRIKNRSELLELLGNSLK